MITLFQVKRAAIPAAVARWMLRAVVIGSLFPIYIYQVFGNNPKFVKISIPDNIYVALCYIH